MQHRPPPLPVHTYLVTHERALAYLWIWFRRSLLSAEDLSFTHEGYLGVVGYRRCLDEVLAELPPSDLRVLDALGVLLMEVHWGSTLSAAIERAKKLIEVSPALFYYLNYKRNRQRPTRMHTAIRSPVRDDEEDTVATAEPIHIEEPACARL